MLMGREWILSIFPDISTRLDDSSVQEELIFKHTFTDSITTCRYIRNEVTIILLMFPIFILLYNLLQ